MTNPKRKFTSMGLDEDFPESVASGQHTASELDRLRNLLVAPEALALQDLQDSLDDLKRRLQDSNQIIELVFPVITEILARKISESSAAVAKTVAPIIDQAIREKTAQDRDSIASVIGPIIMEAITREVRVSPEEFAASIAPISSHAIAKQHVLVPDQVAHDLAPIMGAAIKEQIRSERDAVVDALYPVIGSTIAKYMSEALNNLVRSINEKLEQNLSISRLVRKARARTRGITEAELILRESIPCTVDALFLIQKSSGLVIAQAHKDGSRLFDSDLLSGMLTAIRSFFNDSLSEMGEISELDQIEYGQSKIILEVAGYCYLAAVIEGEPHEHIKAEIRSALSEIVQEYGELLKGFQGDQSSVPEEVKATLHRLIEDYSVSKPRKSRRRPYAFLIAATVIMLLLLSPLVVHWYRNAADHDVEAKTVLAFASSRMFASQGLIFSADRDSLSITGVVPNEYMRLKAQELAEKVTPSINVKNSILVDNTPAFPVLVNSQIESVASQLNTVSGVSVKTSYHEEQLVIEGSVTDSALGWRVIHSFERLPGIRMLTNDILVREAHIPTRIYFDLGSVSLVQSELSKILEFKAFLTAHPDLKAVIVGHSDLSGPSAINRRLALSRAVAVQKTLVETGISESQILAEGSAEYPPGISESDSPSLSRCVRFETLRPLQEAQK